MTAAATRGDQPMLVQFEMWTAATGLLADAMTYSGLAWRNAKSLLPTRVALESEGPTLWA